MKNKSPFIVNKLRRNFVKMGYSEAQFNAVMSQVRRKGHAKYMVHRPTFKACMYLILNLRPQVGKLLDNFYDKDKIRLPANKAHFDVLNDIEQSVYTDDVSDAIHAVAHRTDTRHLGTAINRLERMKRFNRG